MLTLHTRIFLSLSALFALAACSGGTGAADTALPDASFPDTGAVDTGTGLPDTGRPDAGPLSEEICDDGLDNDADALIDEGCFCVPGDTQSCFGAGAENRGVGLCGDGEQTCQDALEFGEWSECDGDVLPAEEACDGATDEDCDGAIDEGCDCEAGGDPTPCGLDVGACTPGSQECVDGMLGECVGATGPGAEVCNGVDDDCDGTVDEALTRRCGSATGECTRGTRACVDGDWEACSGGREPGTEDCNGLDDDCDGTTDESLSRRCGTAAGACRRGNQSCESGAWGTCTGGTTPALETCNDVDDDCDGSTDEDVTRSCGMNVGACSTGTETCAAGTFGACVGGTGPSSEVCEGSVDENCDGTVDEGCGCTIGTSRPCGTGVGECREGSQLCVGGMWDVCSGAIDPVPEVCNGRDDDCDGMADEDGICPTSPPIVSCGGSITAEVLSTVTASGSGSDPDGGSVTYAWTVTDRPTGSTALPTSPSSASTSFFLDASGGFELTLCVTDDEGESACCTVDIVSTPPGVLQVELSWADAHGDVDLHLLNVTRTPPDGWWTADDCNFTNPTPDWGAAGANANPTHDRDDRDGYGPENISIDTAPASGTYNIGVHYYCDTSTGGSGSTEATVRVYCMGALIGTYANITLDETDDWVTVARVTWPGCAGMSVDDRTNGTQTLPASFTSPRHCEINCTSDADCPTGERCRSLVGMGGRRNACWL